MIKIETISKAFRSGRGHVRALNDVSFTLGKGETAAVVGKSGSGKTTMLHCIGGLERPDKGTVICFGANIGSLSAKNLSVFENIAFPLSLNGIGGHRKQSRVNELLEKVGLSNAAGALPHELSGGEIQRISVARAIAHSPRLLLADEPTASLDTITGKKLVELMFDIGRNQECTMIISTHDPEISELADQIIQIKDGRII
jgi:putative ABC transport system ATP-binding protein